MEIKKYIYLWDIIKLMKDYTAELIKESISVNQRINNMRGFKYKNLPLKLESEDYWSQIRNLNESEGLKRLLERINFGRLCNLIAKKDSNLIKYYLRNQIPCDYSLRLIKKWISKNIKSLELGIAPLEMSFCTWG